MTKALSLFKTGGRQHLLEGRYIVQATPVTLEHTDACHRQDVVQARLPGDGRESWGTDIPLGKPVQLCSVEDLDRAVLEFFNRWPDALAPCPTCGQMTWNRKHFASQYRDDRCGDCWFTAFDQQMANWRQQEQDDQRKRDVGQYHMGMRYRTTCIVHPQHGDDIVVDYYTAERLTSEEVQKHLRRKYPDAMQVEVMPIYQLPNH